MSTIDIRHLSSWPCQLHRHVIWIVWLVRVLRTHMFELVWWCTSESEFSLPRRVFDPTIYDIHNFFVNHYCITSIVSWEQLTHHERDRTLGALRSPPMMLADGGHHSMGDCVIFCAFRMKELVRELHPPPNTTCSKLQHHQLIVNPRRYVFIKSMMRASVVT